MPISTPSTTPGKMQAKVYDRSNRFLYSIQGTFQEDHFVWYDGGIPMLRAMPLIRKIKGIGKVEHKITCDIDETYDDVSIYTALYHKIGDRYEQIKISRVIATKHEEVNLEKILDSIELGQARGDAIVTKPADLALLGVIGMVLIGALFLIGLYLGIQGAIGGFVSATHNLSVSTATLNEHQGAFLNLTKNLTNAYTNMTRVLAGVAKEQQIQSAT